MTDKNDEIVSAINALKSEITEQISAAVRTLQQSIREAQTQGFSKGPSNTTTALTAQDAALARELQKYCAETRGQLDPILEQAKQSGQDVVSVQKLMLRMEDHAKTSESDLAAKGGYFLRTESEKLHTTVNILKTHPGPPVKSTTVAIPFKPVVVGTRNATPATEEPKVGAAQPKRKNHPAASHETAAETTSSGKERRSLAAGAKAS